MTPKSQKTITGLSALRHVILIQNIGVKHPSFPFAYNRHPLRLQPADNRKRIIQQHLMIPDSEEHRREIMIIAHKTCYITPAMQIINGLFAVGIGFPGCTFTILKTSTSKQNTYRHTASSTIFTKGFRPSTKMLSRSYKTLEEAMEQHRSGTCLQIK